MLNDAHIHVGQFREIYTSPRELVDFLDNVGVNHFAVSSTTIWEENYEKVLDEIRELIRIAGDRVRPVLWITPSMLVNGGLETFLISEIDWKCVKVHGVHPWSEVEIEQCVQVARKLHVPLLFHTGGFEQCEAGMYFPFIKNNPDVTFILAHARPVEQAIDVMRQCPNAWADTAFAPVDTVKRLLETGFEDRVLFGTDTPLQKVYYPNDSWHKVYLDNVASLRNIANEKQWTKITETNFKQLF